MTLLLSLAVSCASRAGRRNVATSSRGRPQLASSISSGFFLLIAIGGIFITHRAIASLPGTGAVEDPRVRRKRAALCPPNYATPPVTSRTVEIVLELSP